jgi:XTP/dITP diphosphohydrolase
MAPKLLIATTNPGKIREFRQMLGEHRFEWSDLSQHPPITPPEETGRTFQENSALKAVYYARQLAMAALADDSGLQVDALDGKPGVHSARWAQMNAAGQGDLDNNHLLLRQLEGVPADRRTARFVCSLTLADKDGRVLLTAVDWIEGRILESERGRNGFGYDPLFLVESLGLTTAELEPEQKHRISHRGKALQQMRQLIDGLGDREIAGL